MLQTKKKKYRLSAEERHVMEVNRPYITGSCGRCSECCTALAVGELKKGLYAKCRHCTDQGCGIYHDRPNSCHTWYCAYRFGMQPGRPDQCGYIVSANSDSIQIHETRPGTYHYKFEEIAEIAIGLAERFDVYRVVWFRWEPETPAYIGPLKGCGYSKCHYVNVKAGPLLFQFIKAPEETDEEALAQYCPSTPSGPLVRPEVQTERARSLGQQRVIDLQRAGCWINSHIC